MRPNEAAHRGTKAANPRIYKLPHGPLFTKCLEEDRLLKKSMSARSAVQKGPEPRPKHYKNVVFSPWFRG